MVWMWTIPPKFMCRNLVSHCDNIQRLVGPLRSGAWWKGVIESAAFGWD
jgi:hypothetical protein